MVKKTESPLVERQHKKQHLLVIAIFLIAASASALFWEHFYDDPDLDWTAIEEAQREAEEIVNRHSEWVQYALIANSTMKRPCLRCPGGVDMVTVREGEIYKYGITTRGVSRYSQSFISLLDLRFFIEYKGSYIECKEMEINKIVSYKFLPESQKPEIRLIRPPGNANRN